jgi:DNA replication and repair protein RecF
LYLNSIALRNFRNYLNSGTELAPGINIFIGGNGAGKSNILEAAQYGCCGRSFRTSREAEMVMEGQGFFRLEAELDIDGRRSRRAVTYEPGTGPRVEANGGPRWQEGGAMLCFSPDDLQLIKGPPALRRRFLDEAVSARLPSHIRLVRDYRQVLSQRNRFLQRARTGLVELTEISPWDRQLTVLALKITAARDEYGRRGYPPFVPAARRF